MTTTGRSGDRPTAGEAQRARSNEARGRRVAAFVRHGHFDRPEQVASAHLPLPLSADGREQARSAAATILRHCDEPKASHLILRFLSSGRSSFQ